MRKILFTVAIALAGTCAMAQTIIRPTVKTPTSFAIVVDSKSYDEARNEVNAYRESIENEGLGTYILAHDWQSPDSIRNLLKSLYESKSPLEGCVFVGDIPIPMIRDAQHLCSAFKMRQTRYPWHRSSVPSDRFYDDFDLKFDYLKHDSVRHLYHYYSLRADSRQFLSPDIYSGRILPLTLDGCDRYQMLRDYLNKVVADKKANKDNIIDRLTVARGHGYNSEDMIAWSGEHIALREQLPRLFNPGGTVKFHDFEIYNPAKNLYLNEVQQPGLDIMLFHHHGGVTAQYLSGYPNVNAVDPSIENIKRFLRSKVASMAEKKGREAAVEHYAKAYDVPVSWCEEAFDSAKIAEDSIFNYHLDIHTQDIRQITPNARFVMFDACFNGSFHQKDNLAGSYIFNPGKTVATQANSVNTIQDKWPDEFLGLLATGMRIGHFNRLNCFLETHIIGDPTMRFAPDMHLPQDINHSLALRKGDISFWKKQLDNPMPDMQALALRELENAGYDKIVPTLNDAYFQSPHFVVRLEAMRLMALNHPTNATAILAAAINDSYELTRRFAAEYIEKNASPQLLEAWVNAYVQRPQEKRMKFKILNGIKAFDHDMILDEVEKQTAAQPLYNRDMIDNFTKQVNNSARNAVSDRAIIDDPKSKPGWIYTELSRYRNHPTADGIDMLISFLQDTSRSLELRLVAAETLGWYTMYHDKASIINRLKTYTPDDDRLDTEITKTVNRLQSKNR